MENGLQRMDIALTIERTEDGQWEYLVDIAGWMPVRRRCTTWGAALRSAKAVIQGAYTEMNKRAKGA